MIDSAFLELSDGSVAMVDNIDISRVARYDWRAPSGRERYVVGLDFADGPCPDMVYLHRLVADAGPEDVVAHRNGNTLDNRRDNLVVYSRRRVGAPAFTRPPLELEAQVAD